MTRLEPTMWNQREGLPQLVDALGKDRGDTRFVGGFVRDSLLGIASSDIDCATRLKPDEVLNRIKAAGFKAVPTGIAHGTVTAVLPSGAVEITTLRRDVSTDGRRATIAYTDDWREDAARRDFTINALSADPSSGTLYDYFGGVEDLASGRVRFIGEPLTRIAEDHLRILRFFRFHARFGKGAPDPAALAACDIRSNDLMALSRERIAEELLKLMALPDPAPTVSIMVAHHILRAVLPEIDDAAPERLASLVAAEHGAGMSADPVRRLAALLPSNPDVAQAIGVRLRLSNAARKRLSLAHGPADAGQARALAYRVGRDSAIDRLLLQGDIRAADEIFDWEIPRLPISGGALVQRGLTEGPIVAKSLQAVEARWIAEGFPDAARVDQIADDVIRELCSR